MAAFGTRTAPHRRWIRVVFVPSGLRSTARPAPAPRSGWGRGRSCPSGQGRGTSQTSQCEVPFLLVSRFLQCRQRPPQRRQKACSSGSGLTRTRRLRVPNEPLRSELGGQLASVMSPPYPPQRGVPSLRYSALPGSRSKAPRWIRTVSVRPFTTAQTSVCGTRRTRVFAMWRD